MQSVNRARPRPEIVAQAKMSEQLAKLQQQISTGKKIDKPSDDPAAWSRISDIARLQSDMTAWQRNVNRGQSISRQAADTIGDINNQLIRVSELTIQAASDTMSSDNRALIAQEIEAITESIAELIDQNSTFGSPLFPSTGSSKIPIGNGQRLSVAPPKSTFSELKPSLEALSLTIRNGSSPNISSHLTPLENLMTSMITLVGHQGIVINQLEEAANRLIDQNLTASEYRSGYEDTDLTRTISDSQQVLLNLQAAQATYARVQQTSLFDFLR